MATARGYGDTARVRRRFVEQRTDLRIEFGSSSAPGIVETDSSGVALRVDDGSELRGSTTLPAGAATQKPAIALEPALDWMGDVVRAAGKAAVRGVWIESDQHVAIAGENGREVHDRRRGARARVSIELVRGGDRRATATVDVVRSASGFADPQGVADALVARAEARFETFAVEPGEHVAVFDAGVGGVLIHELIGHALEGDVLEARASRLALEDLRFRLEDVRVVDDPRRCRVPWSVDDDGEPARAVGLIERGRVAGRLLDRAHATRLGQPSTAHGRRASYLDEVRPRMGCTFLAAGRLDPEEVREGIHAGLFVRRMEAASADPTAGSAVFRVVDADRIVDDRLERALEPFLMEVRLIDLFETLDRIGRDVAFDRCVGACVRGGQPLVTSVGAPTIRVGLVRVVR